MRFLLNLLMLGNGISKETDKLEEERLLPSIRLKILAQENGGKRRKRDILMTSITKVSFPPIRTIKKKRNKGRDKSHAVIILS